MGFLGPDEGPWVLVPAVEKGLDVLAQSGFGLEVAVTQGLPGQDAEKSLDLVQPRGAGRRVMETDLGVTFEPALDGWRRVCRRVVEDHVQLLPAVLLCK